MGPQYRYSFPDARVSTGTGPVYSTYDHQGRLLWQLDPSGQERVLTRDANKRINTETNIRKGEDVLRIVSSNVTRYDALARPDSYRVLGSRRRRHMVVETQRQG